LFVGAVIGNIGTPGEDRASEIQVTQDSHSPVARAARKAFPLARSWPGNSALTSTVFKEPGRAG
jgi:hypothetical protein